MKNIFQKFPAELQGGILIILAFVIIGPNDILVPIIARESGLWQFHFCRSLIAITLMSLLMILTGHQFIINNLFAVIIRSLLYTFSMLIYFGCLSFLPIAIVGAGMFSAPIFVLIFSYFLFKQKIGINLISAVVVGSFGVWLILNPSAENFSIYGLMPIFGGLFLAMGNMVTWRMCSEENPLILNIMFFIGIGIFGFIGTIIFSVFTFDINDLVIISDFFILGWNNGTALLWALIFVQAVGSIIGIGLLTKAYQMADTSYLNIFEYSFFIFAGFSGWLFLGQTISFDELIGIIFIIFSGIIASFASNKKILKKTF